MKRVALGMVPILALLGCGGEAKPRPALGGIAQAAEEDSEAVIQARAIDFVVHEKAPADGTPRKPKFRLRAERGSALEDGVYALQDIRVVAYGRDPSEGPIEITAERGRYEEGKSAYLEGGVQVAIGKKILALQDIYLEIEEGGGVVVARTDNPVRISAEGVELEAETLRIYPETNRFTMTGVVVVLQLRREE